MYWGIPESMQWVFYGVTGFEFWAQLKSVMVVPPSYFCWFILLHELVRYIYHETNCEIGALFTNLAILTWSKLQQILWNCIQLRSYRPWCFHSDPGLDATGHLLWKELLLGGTCRLEQIKCLRSNLPNVYMLMLFLLLLLLWLLLWLLLLFLLLLLLLLLLWLLLWLWLWSWLLLLLLLLLLMLWLWLSLSLSLLLSLLLSSLSLSSSSSLSFLLLMLLMLLSWSWSWLWLWLWLFLLLSLSLWLLLLLWLWLWLLLLLLLLLPLLLWLMLSWLMWYHLWDYMVRLDYSGGIETANKGLFCQWAIMDFASRMHENQEMCLKPKIQSRDMGLV